jgi:hypothetical protein
MPSAPHATQVPGVAATNVFVEHIVPVCVHPPHAP